MAEKARKSFAEFVKEAPTAAEATGRRTVALTGAVMRSEREGAFLLALPSGQTIELPMDAVEDYNVVQEGAQQRIVQLQVNAERLAATQPLGQSPFVTATPHQAPQAALELQGHLKPIVSDIRTTYVADMYTFKEMTTDPLADQFTRKEITTDPLNDQITRKELIKESIKDAVGDPNTWVEQTFDPADILTNPPVWNLPGMMF